MLGEMLLGLSTYVEYPALCLYPWVLAWLVWMKSSGSQIPYDIPVVFLNDFTHPNKIPEKDFPYAIDGERYYFTKQVPRDASGKRSKRKAGKKGAYWKSISKDIVIPFPDSEGKPIGYMRKYTLYENMDDKRSANWYMEEYRVLDPNGLADPYILCKIYDKESCCPKYTDTSIRALRKRLFERQLGSHPDQTNSQFDNMNQSQTQFDDSNFPKDVKQSTFPPLENIPPESILPNPGPPSYSNEHAGFSNLFSMSHEHVDMQPTLPTSVHRKRNKKNNFAYFCSSERKKTTTLPTSENFPPESTLPTSGPPSDSLVLPMVHDVSSECSMSRDPSGNLNPPESVRPIPGPPDYSNGFSMSHDLSGNLNPPESTLPIHERPRYSNEFPMYGGISNDFSMSHDLSGNLNAPDGEESPLDCHSQLWNHGNLYDEMEW